MSNDYKLKLLKWLCGDYQVEAGSNTQQMFPVVKTTNTFKTDFEAQFPDGYLINGFIPAKDNKGNGIGFTVLYGLYQVGSSYKGFITILDEQFNIVQTFTKYNDNTDIGYLVVLNVDEKGNYFGIEGDSASSNHRVIKLNNITAKLPTEQNYSLIKRESYNIVTVPGIEPGCFVKAPNREQYLLYGSLCKEYKIQNNSISATIYTIPNSIYINSILPSWDSDGVLTINGIGDNGTNFYNISSNGTTTLQSQQISGVSAGGMSYQSIITSDGKKYIYKPDSNWSSYFYYEIYYVSGNSASSIYREQAQWTNVYGLYPTIGFVKNEDSLFFLQTNFDAATPTKWIYSVGQISQDTQVQVTNIGEIAYTGSEPVGGINIQSQFNLYKVFIQMDNTLFTTGEVYNSQNYNGLAYQNYESLTPNSVNMYDENDDIIFSRNLYNKVISGNITTSTVVVPNSYLNNIEINLKELVSKCNNIMTDDNEQIEKNVYEELYVNFSNAITIRNANDPNNIIYNDTGAIRLNNVVSDTPTSTDYNNSKIAKIRINYSDNTNEIQLLNTNSLVYTGLKTTLQFYIFTPNDKDILSIDFVSGDENTIYQTIYPSLQRGKLYNIEQKVEVL